MGARVHSKLMLKLDVQDGFYGLKEWFTHLSINHSHFKFGVSII